MINIRQIEAFRAVIQHGTVTSAASALHVSQPAVSRLVKDLEYYLGFLLFQRKKGRLVPTPEALALVDEIDKAFLGIEKVIDAAKDIREFRTGRLFVSSLPSLALTFLPVWVTEFSNQYPEISISLQTHSSQRVLEWVTTQQCDIGFIGMDLEDPTVDVIPITNNPLQLVMPADHDLAHKDIIYPNDLDNMPFVSFGQSRDVKDHVEKAFRKAKVKPHIKIKTQLSSVACRLVESGAGVSLVDPLTAIYFKEKGLAVRPFTPEIPFKYRAVLPNFRPVSRLAQEFLDQVRTNVDNLLDINKI